MQTLISDSSVSKRQFWQTLDELVAASEFVVDRPKGSAHPRFPDLVYPLDYGYLDGTNAGDGDGIDVWIGNAEGKRVTAIACTVDGYKRDAEIKVLLACSDDDLNTILHFLNEVAGLPCIVVPNSLISSHG
jgi:inorganic pyrophosphatase